MLKIKKLKYRHKIALVIFVFTLLPMIILGSFLFGRIWDEKQEEILSGIKMQLSSKAAEVDSLFNSGRDKVMNIKNNYYITNFLETNVDRNLVGIMSFYDYLQSMMDAVRADNKRMEIVIYSLNEVGYDSDYIRSIGRFKSELTEKERNLPDEILKAEEMGASDQSGFIWRLRYIESGYFNQGDEHFFICSYKKISSVYNVPFAILETRVPFSQIAGHFDVELPEGSYIIYTMKNDARRFAIKDGKLDMAATDKLSDTDYYNEMSSKFFSLAAELKSGVGSINMLIPKNYILQEFKWYLIWLLAFFTATAAVFFLIIEIVAFYLTKKLSGLLQKMNTNVETLIESDNFQIYRADDEFGTIGNMFFELITKVKEYFKKLTQFEFEKKILEVRLLQERINPHFLYNTLSTLKWISGDKKVQKVIDSLVKYYRIALNKGSSIIKVSQELEMIEEYLILQKFAYGKDFDFEIKIEEDAGNYLILKHLLQPVVENAVLHGLNRITHKGLIKILCGCHDSCIVFEISDNGKGMEQEVLEKILQDGNNGMYGGYGMKNIRKRIEIFYGNSYGIDIKSSPGEGTTVFMRIPCFADADIQDSHKFIQEH